MSPTTDSLIGRLIDGRYLVRSRIAHGGMATVFLAKDRRLDRDVALKVMHPHLTEGTDVSARFRREARAAARLAHPGVVAVFDQGTDGDLSYLTMEYVEGHNLRHELRRQGALALGHALLIISSVLDALGAAHRSGVVHRDVKPENVLLTQSGTVKVADFGLARAVTEATMASTGNLLGTVAYLSPEIITSGTADATADVYAVGIMLFELLNGHPPFSGQSPIHVAYQHVHSEAPSITDHQPWVPSEVDHLIRKFCASNPNQRPLDALEAKEQLLEVLENLSVQDRQARNPHATDLSTTDEPTKNIEQPATALLPLAPLNQPVQEIAPSEPERRSSTLRRTFALLGILTGIIGLIGAGSWWYLTHGPGAYTTIPPVVGTEEERARDLLESAELPYEISRENSDDVPDGEVIRTEPEEDTRVLRGSTVQLVVSDGELLITIPEMEGMQEEEINQALTTSGWDGPTLTIMTEWSQEVEEGYFISASPAPGEEIHHADPITIVMSAGPRPVTLLNVVGKDVEEAVSELESQKLSAVVIEEKVFSDSIAEDHIVSQDPEQGSELFEGDEVVLTVSKGPELVEVPSVTFLSFEEAKEVLEAEGFDVERRDRFGGALGRVRFQDPEPGTEHPKGATVTLTVL